jgi:hypothetical protein
MLAAQDGKKYPSECIFLHIFTQCLRIYTIELMEIADPVGLPAKALPPRSGLFGYPVACNE